MFISTTRWWSLFVSERLWVDGTNNKITLQIAVCRSSAHARTVSFVYGDLVRCIACSSQAVVCVPHTSLQSFGLWWAFTSSNVAGSTYLWNVGFKKWATSNVKNCLAFQQTLQSPPSGWMLVSGLLDVLLRAGSTAREILKYNIKLLFPQVFYRKSIATWKSWLRIPNNVCLNR